MRIAVVTLVVSLAATVGLATPSAGTEPTDRPSWSKPVDLGGDYGGSLLVAPDGSAQAATEFYGPQGCPGCDHRTFFERDADGGEWHYTPISTTTYEVDAYDGQSRAWHLALRKIDETTQQVTLRSRASGGAWGPDEDVPGAVHVNGSPLAEVVLTPDDRPVVVTTRPADGGFELGIFERRTDGTWLTSTHTTSSMWVDAVTTAAGAVQATWSSEGTPVVVAERRADGSWAADATLPGTDGTPTWVAPDSLTVAGDTLQVADRTDDGSWVVHQLGGIYGAPAGVAHTDGTIDLAWIATAGDVLTASRGHDHGWARPVRLGRGAENGATIVSVGDRAGNLTVGWTGNDRAHLRQRPVGGGWLPEQALPTRMRETAGWSFEIGADADGRITALAGGWVSVLTPPVAVSSVDRAPASGWATTSKFGIGWKTTWTQADTHDVRYRVRRIDRNASDRVDLATATKARSAVIRGKAGRVYCVSARAHTATTTGPWGTERCIATPLDDRALKAGKGWTHTGGTSLSRTRGATLTSPRIHGTRFALLVNPSAGAGRVKVTIGGRSLGTHRLTKGHRNRPRIIDLGGFKHTQHGKLVITVVSSGKPVRINGIYTR